MKLFLDTHTFLWLMEAPEKISRRAREGCEDPENELLLSVASVWEIQIKVQLGKLDLETSLSEMLQDQQESIGLAVVPIELEHVLALDELPLHHKDPFDRLLVSQCRSTDTPLVTADKAVGLYDVRILW